MAWSGDLSPDIQIDIFSKVLVGRGNGESLQMVCRGEGFVVIPPYEEVYFPGAPQ